MLCVHPVSPSLPFGQAEQGGGGLGIWGVSDPALSLTCRGFTSKGHHLQSPAFRPEVSLHRSQEWDFHECGLMENDLGGRGVSLLSPLELMKSVKPWD